MPLTPADCDKRPGSRSCSAWYIAGRLGHRHRSPPWIFKQIAALIAHEGFPPPIVLYACTGRAVARVPAEGAPSEPRKVAGLTPASRWQLEPVDAWFDGQPSACIPPDIAASAGAIADARTADLLDQRAAALAGGVQ